MIEHGGCKYFTKCICAFGVLFEQEALRDGCTFGAILWYR